MLDQSSGHPTGNGQRAAMCELPGTANGLAVSCAYRVSIAIMQPQVAEKHPTIGGNQRILQIKYCLEKNVAR